MYQKLSVFVFMLFSLSSFAQNAIELIEEQVDNAIVLTAINTTDQSVEVVLTLTSTGFGLKKEERFTEVIDAKSKSKMVSLVPTPGRKCTYSANLAYTTKTEAPTSQKVSTTTKTTSASQTNAKHQSAPATQKQVVNKIKPNNPMAGKKGIVVYSKNGCGRCDYVTKYLSDNNIPFQDLNITTDKAADAQMGKVLFANGFKGGSFTTPVITVDEEVHYNIKDLKSFLAELK